MGVTTAETNAGASAPSDVRGSSPRRNVGDLERVLSAVGGGALALLALRRRGLSGLALGVAGTELLRRGATGHCRVYEALGVSTANRNVDDRDDVTSRAATVNARKAVKIERRMLVRRPADDLYALWRDFSRLPRFMRYLDSVTCSDALHSHWVARLPGGAHIEWDAEIVNDIEGSLIAWKTVGAPDIAHAGSVHFTPFGDANATDVRVVFDYEPPAARTIGLIAAHLGLTPETLVVEDLRRFKAFAEGRESGAGSEQGLPNGTTEATDGR
jgi:uncharacterized membrane protein